jgi:hypothetical protein
LQVNIIISGVHSKKKVKLNNEASFKKKTAYEELEDEEILSDEAGAIESDNEEEKEAVGNHAQLLP